MLVVSTPKGSRVANIICSSASIRRGGRQKEKERKRKARGGAAWAVVRAHLNQVGEFGAVDDCSDTLLVEHVPTKKDKHEQDERKTVSRLWRHRKKKRKKGGR